MPHTVCPRSTWTSSSTYTRTTTSSQPTARAAMRGGYCRWVSGSARVKDRCACRSGCGAGTVVSLGNFKCVHRCPPEVGRAGSCRRFRVSASRSTCRRTPSRTPDDTDIQPRHARRIAGSTARRHSRAGWLARRGLSAGRRCPRATSVPRPVASVSANFCRVRPDTATQARGRGVCPVAWRVAYFVDATIRSLSARPTDLASTATCCSRAAIRIA